MIRWEKQNEKYCSTIVRGGESTTFTLKQYSTSEELGQLLSKVNKEDFLLASYKRNELLRKSYCQIIAFYYLHKFCDNNDKQNAEYLE